MKTKTELTMTCTKIPIPKNKIKATLRASQQRLNVPMFAYDCPKCGAVHLTTEVPGSKPDKRII